jgi:hypothetical protein
MHVLVERDCYCRNRSQRIYSTIRVSEFGRLKLKRLGGEILLRSLSVVLSMEFSDCSEETRGKGRRPFTGLLEPLGGCGAVLKTNSFDVVSGVSQSDTKEHN